MNGYSFWCSKCKKDHVGECEKPAKGGMLSGMPNPVKAIQHEAALTAAALALCPPCGACTLVAPDGSIAYLLGFCGYCGQTHPPLQFLSQPQPQPPAATGCQSCTYTNQTTGATYRIPGLCVGCGANWGSPATRP